MKRKTVVLVSLLVGSLFLIASDGLAKAKTKKELQDEAKKAAEQRTKQIEQLDKTKKLSEKIIEQQRLILQQQEALRDTIERTRFQARAIVGKAEVEAGRPIPFELVVTNGSQKAFWIDGRKPFPPAYEILDEKEKVVLSSKDQKALPPVKKEELVKLNPSASLALPKGEALAPSKPGTYRLRASYTFEGTVAEEVSDVWLGTIYASPVQVKVLEKKGR